MAITAGIIAGVGAVASGTGTVIGMVNSKNAADASQKALDQQNANQQALLTQEQQGQADQKAAAQNNAAMTASQNEAALAAGKTGGRTGTILTSPLAALGGTRGVPAAPTPNAIGSLGTMGMGGGKTLLGS